MNLLMFLVLSIANAHDGHHHPDMDQNRPQPILGDSVYNIKEKWMDQRSTQVHLSDLKGSPVVLAMVYTSCQSACPMIVSKMQAVESKLSDLQRTKTKFVLVSFDPSRDTPARLSEFAHSRKLVAGKWQLLTGSESGVRQLAAVLGIKYRKEKNGDFSHSNIITLLDAEGVIREQKIGLDANDQPLVEALKKL